MLSSKREVRLLRGKYFLLQGKTLAKILSVNERENRVVLYRYDKFEREHIEYDTAQFYLIPMFKIGELAKMIHRSTDTIRKYERQGLIDRPTKYVLSLDGATAHRFYTVEQVEKIAMFFALQPPPGRKKRTNSKVNKKELMKKINSRFKEIK